jgi:hypothetical protein
MSVRLASTPLIHPVQGFHHGTYPDMVAQCCLACLLRAYVGTVMELTRPSTYHKIPPLAFRHGPSSGSQAPLPLGLAGRRLVPAAYTQHEEADTGQD